MSNFVELVLDQGTTFNNIVTVKNTVTNNVINIAAYTFISQMRRSYYSSNISANIVCTITDAANGILTMSLDAANTANLKPNKYLFDVSMKDTANVVSRLVEGVIIVTPDVTR